MFINDLHFQVDQGILVKNYPDIKEKGLITGGFAKYDRIRNLHGRDL